MNHLGSTNVAYRLERLQPLVENAGINIVQVPTLTENTAPPHTHHEFSRSPPLGSNGPTMSIDTPVDVPSQVAGPSNHMQHSETIPPTTNPGPPRKRRRKLNSAIFDVDTAAALRIKAHTESPTTELKGPPFPEVTVQQEAPEVATPSDPLLKPPHEITPVERLSDVVDVEGGQPRAQSEDANFRNHQSTTSQLAETGIHQREPSPEVVSGDSSRTTMQGSQPPEVRVATFVTPSRSDLSLGNDSGKTARRIPGKSTSRGSTRRR